MRRISFKSVIITTLVIALSVGIFGGCQTQIKSSVPTEKLFDYQQVALENGLKVITLEDFSCPIVAAQVWYQVSSKDEDPQRQGFAHMFEHMMFKGTDIVGNEEHFGSINKVGGSNNAYTSFDATVYLQTLPADQLDLALWLEAERMTFLNINQDTFDTERKVVEEELRMRENRPYGGLSKKQFKELFKEHPYRWTPIGKLSHLRSASTAELRDFWKTYYVPSNATLVIVGAVKHNDAQEMAKKYFGWIPKYPQPERVTIKEPAQAQQNVVIIDDEKAPAGMIEIDWRTVPLGHPDEVVLGLTASILGGDPSSRLYRQLVDKKELAVATDASTYNLQDDGLFSVSATQGLDDNTDKIIEAIWANIAKIAAGNVGKRELEKARRQMLKRVVTGNLTVDSKARMLGNAAVREGDVSRVNRLLDEIKDVTRDDIKRVARQYLSKDSSVVFIVKKNTETSGTKDNEDSATSAKEETSPKPGRGDLERPSDWPMEPPFAELIAYKASPKYTTATLENGLKVMVVPNHELPFVSIKLGLKSGMITEETPSAAFMAMSMLTGQTKKRSQTALSKILAENAITLQGTAGKDSSELNANCLTESVDKAIELMAEVVTKPAFKARQFEKLRKRELTRLSIEESTPRYLVGKEFNKQIYGDHPYARTVKGQTEDVATINVKDAKQWWAVTAAPAKATLIFAGDIEFERAVELARKSFGRWKAQKHQTDIEIAKFPQIEKTRIVIVDMPGSAQSEIRVGQFGITRHQQPDYFVSRVVGNYFGGSFNSRLNESLRIQKGLTYGAWGSYIAENTGGVVVVSTFTKTETSAQAVKAIFEEVDRLRTEEPSDKELDESKSFLSGYFVRSRETPQKVAVDLWLMESQELGFDYLDNLLEKISTTTKQDCLNLVNNTIDPDKMVVVVVGDAEKIKTDLEKIAPVTVIQSNSAQSK